MTPFRKIPVEDFIPRRELLPEGRVDPTSRYPDVRWDYLTIYDQGGNVLARSRSMSKVANIHLTYRGLTFIATPGYDGIETVSVEWDSLVNLVTEEEIK